jgi:hypothetical protein
MICVGVGVVENTLLFNSDRGACRSRSPTMTAIILRAGALVQQDRRHGRQRLTRRLAHPLTHAADPCNPKTSTCEYRMIRLA